ncbi:MAG: hypothetical protein CME19_09060 [Gemmatimonadetes bacterium]|nr:hypothetical protein [Gemmatimonadota bacterium]
MSSDDRIVKGQVAAELDDTALKSQLGKVERDLEPNRLQQQEFEEWRSRELILLEAERDRGPRRWRQTGSSWSR